MPYIKDGENNLLFIPSSGSNGSAVNTDAYVNNLKCALIEDFSTSNQKWSITNGTLSENGLVCNGYTKAEYQSQSTIDTEKAVIQFVYSSDVVIGMFLSKTLVWVDTDNKTMNIYGSYDHSSTLPTATSSEQISFNFVQDHVYELCIERTLCTNGYAVLRDTVSGDELEIDIGISMARLTNAFGCCVFSGQTVINKFLYYAPVFDTAKVLIVGDSITFGGAVTDKSKRWGTQIIQDYFHNNGVQCAIGGNSSSNVSTMVNSLFSLGYKFDYVLIAMGTNDSTPTSTSKAWYENLISSIESHDCEVIWCIPPRASATDTESRVAAVREVLLSIDGLKVIRFDHATSTNGAYDSQYFADGLHTNALGHQRQYEFAKSALELYGIS